MDSILEIEKLLIDEERKKLNLPSPREFEEQRITPEIIGSLMVLLQLPFDQSFVGRTRNSGFSAKGVSHDIQFNRLQEVFGYEHINLETIVNEVVIVPSKDENKNDMYYCDVTVIIKIGNWTFYTDSTNKPCSTFVPYYVIEGNGWGSSYQKGIAKKNAIANGKKDAFRSMGMLRYLYIEDIDDKDDYKDDKPTVTSENITTIELLNNPTVSESGTIFFKGKVKDLSNNDMVTAIIYKENKYNKEEHDNMISMLNKYKHELIKGKTLTVEYIEKKYGDEDQYIVQKIMKRGI